MVLAAAFHGTSCTSSTHRLRAPCRWASVCWNGFDAATAFSAGLVAKSAPCRAAHVRLVHLTALRLVSAPPSAGMVLTKLLRCAQAHVHLVGQRSAPRTAPSHASHMGLRLPGWLWLYAPCICASVWLGRLWLRAPCGWTSVWMGWLWAPFTGGEWPYGSNRRITMC